MSVFYRDIVLDDTSNVREVDGLEGWSSNTSNAIVPMKWSKICSKGSFGKVQTMSNITVDGTTYGSINVLRLFGYSSGSQTYAKWVINNPLLPGETLELSFYASTGIDVGSITYGSAGANPPTRVAQITFSTDSNKFDDHLHFPTTAPQRNTVTHEYGDGNVPTANGSNVGVVTSWQSKSGRSANTWVDCPNTPGSEPATLDIADVPNETGNEYTKVYRIVIRNDSAMPAYLAMTSWMTNAIYFYTTYHDIQLKVTSRSLKAALGQVEDNTQHMFHASPHYDVSSTNFLNMNMHSFVNVGTPSIFPNAAQNDYAEGTHEFSTHRAQYINKKFYDHWSVYRTPVYLPFNGGGHNSATDVFAPFANLDFDFQGNGGGSIGDTSEGVHAKNTWVYMPYYAGRFYSVTIKTETPFRKNLRVRLYKFNSHPGDTSGSATKTLLGTINLSKTEGYDDSKDSSLTGYLKITGSGDGIFSSGDLLMLAIDTTDFAIAFGNIVGTVTLMRSS